MNIIGLTHTGLVRTTNQDSFKKGIINEAIAYAVVCDGMGGVNGGHIASNMATSVIEKDLSLNIYPLITSEMIKPIIEDAVKNANNKIYRESIKDKELNGMGTTCVLALVMNGTAHIINVGDSRAYLIKDKKITQITKDHSIVQELIDFGQITETEAKNHPQKNIITRALGTEKEVVIDYYDFPFEDNIILLCSDGLSNYLSEEEILKFLSENDNLESACQNMIDAVNNRGGNDNITVVVISG